MTETPLSTLIERSRVALRAMPSGLTRHEIAIRLFATVKGLKNALVPQLLTKWVWDQMRGMKDPDTQLSFFGVFADKGKMVIGEEARVWSIDDWTEEQHLALWRRYDHNERAAKAKKDAVAAHFQQKFGEQLELWAKAR